ncbi:3-phosphoshikimate 1-carboxyvinyltransferase [Pontibacillus marinus]|uniref:3-phosphoshikimate 1-carboxyvinyltransferase n=1 Tax=Pontibacillus marinus BH030004 = DSM 16465 TaxID=1385511 RepID=A0A0A5FTK6_9BACI|nr:3-phosphoshikimate 1-carboxyvinyltransferase [Pontibacillus marinus]KGX84091.1 3-phosphoshikimate 1-carboxyvinyltransferase [Pontibacillus marinus BH030004 = DSM 16465]
MLTFSQKEESSIKGTISVPGDKSISHRAIMLAALANGESKIKNFLTGEDCLSTLQAFEDMGVSIKRDGQSVSVTGEGLNGLKEAKVPLDLGNSGTTTRLLLGILAGTPNHYCIYGDQSLTKRPMDRVTLPLREMGAKIDGREDGNLLPISVRGGSLKPISYTLPINSAQVKSSVLLAGLFAEGVTKVIEPVPTRDHTERMLKAFQVDVTRAGNEISLKGNQTLIATDIEVPGDISSAAFFLCAAAMKKGSHITVKDVGLNPTRTGVVDVLKRMGANLSVSTNRYIGDEPIGDITVDGGNLKGMTISGDDIPRLIDELPIIALVASQAKGKTVIQDARELRLKETDRIQAVVDTLSKMGVSISGTEDGMIIEGRQGPLNGGTFNSYHDHRIGMMVAIASLLTDESVTLTDEECISISYPSFFEDFGSLTGSHV